MIKVEASKKRFLKKPRGKIVVGISSKKTLRSFTGRNEPIVKEIEPKEFVRDDKSQFFKEEFKREKVGINEWMS